jgi:hypothetical protein
MKIHFKVLKLTSLHFPTLVKMCLNPRTLFLTHSPCYALPLVTNFKLKTTMLMMRKFENIDVDNININWDID